MKKAERCQIGSNKALKITDREVKKQLLEDL
jgi:hypothetical protein